MHLTCSVWLKVHLAWPPSRLSLYARAPPAAIHFLMKCYSACLLAPIYCSSTRLNTLVAQETTTSFLLLVVLFTRGIAFPAHRLSPHLDAMGIVHQAIRHPTACYRRCPCYFGKFPSRVKHEHTGNPFQGSSSCYSARNLDGILA